MFWNLVFLFVVVFGEMWGPQTPRQSQLESEVKSYHRHFSAGRYDRMWDMSSRDFKNRNDNDKERYISNLKQNNFGAVRVRISRIHITQNRALVTVRLRVWSNQDRKWAKDVVLEQWVFEEETWRFDKQLPQPKTNGYTETKSRAAEQERRA